MASGHLFQEIYQRLSHEFREAIKHPGEWYTWLSWTRRWYRPSEKQQAGSIFCSLGPGLYPKRRDENGNQLGSYVTASDFGEQGSLELFSRLAVEAGAALPGAVRNPLSRYFPFFSSGCPRTRWCALLFALEEIEPQSATLDEFGDYCIDIRHPFSASIDAIAVCGLTTNQPKLPDSLITRLDIFRRTTKPPEDGFSFGADTSVPQKAPVAVSPSGRVKLFGRDDLPLIDDKPVPQLTEAQYDLVKRLLGAGEAGLTKDELGVDELGVEEHGGARSTYYDLCDSPHWAEVMRRPGRRGVRYRIT